jgi:hypothetical protein
MLIRQDQNLIMYFRIFAISFALGIFVAQEYPQYIPNVKLITEKVCKDAGKKLKEYSREENENENQNKNDNET